MITKAGKEALAAEIKREKEQDRIYKKYHPFVSRFICPICGSTLKGDFLRDCTNSSCDFSYSIISFEVCSKKEHEAKIQEYNKEMSKDDFWNKVGRLFE